VSQQPPLDVRCLVGGVVVTDQVDVQAGGHLLVEGDQEFLELLGPVAAMEGADHLAGGHVERGEQGGGAGADVVVGGPFRDSGHHRQDWLRPVQCLDLRLPVHAEHQRPLGRVQVEADDVVDLVDEVRVRR
jgi:hypothetical protein